MNEKLVKLKLVEILESYRCFYSLDDDGDGLPLIDMLTFDEHTVDEGKIEIERIADLLYDEGVNIIY